MSKKGQETNTNSCCTSEDHRKEPRIGFGFYGRYRLATVPKLGGKVSATELLMAE